MRELRIVVPGYVGPELSFTDQEEVFKRFPHRGRPEHHEVCRRARAWLTRGVAEALAESALARGVALPSGGHVLIVEAGP